MHVRALSWRTDLLVNRFDGRMEDRGDHLFVETPSNPTFYWGNYLLFDGPPRDGDFARWTGLFADAFAHAPGVRHVALGWDGTEGAVGEVAPFLDAGFTLDPAVTLVATEVVPPPRPNDRVRVRPLVTDGEWAAALEYKIAGADGFDPETYRPFKTAKMACWRRMVEQGRGRWFGAFDGDVLVADCGVVTDGELARFQSVATSPAHRRRGIAGTLVYEVARHALGEMGVRRVVIVAEADEAPARIYASVGFREVERSMAVVRMP